MDAKDKAKMNVEYGDRVFRSINVPCSEFTLSVCNNWVDIAHGYTSLLAEQLDNLNEAVKLFDENDDETYYDLMNCKVDILHTLNEVENIFLGNEIEITEHNSVCVIKTFARDMIRELNGFIVFMTYEVC